jgi:murein DD-endopeptidase MepM/ murein hydrolase activator NlpD
MTTTIPLPDQYVRFGSNFGQPITTTMTGRGGSAVGANINVQGFTAGNLSQAPYGLPSAKPLNTNMVDAGSNASVRAYVQAILPPELDTKIDKNNDQITNIIVKESSRITSGQGTRQGGSTGTLEHQGIDLNRDSQGSGAVIHSPVSGTVIFAGVGRTNTIQIRDPEGNLHEFLHSTNIAVTAGQSIAAGDVLSTVSNFYTGVSVPAHLHYQIRGASDPTKLISVEDFAASHPIEANVQQTLQLPNGAGTLELAVGQINLTTASGQTFAFDLNSTNVSNMRFNAQEQTFSFRTGGGLTVEVGTSANNTMGGQVYLPNGDTVPFSKDGLTTYSDGSIMLSQPDGSIRSIEPGINSTTGQFVWIDRVMTRTQAAAEFGADVELPPAPPIVQSTTPTTSTSNTVAIPNETTVPTPVPGGGEVWFGSDAGGAIQQRMIPAAFEQTDIDGVTYTVHASGLLTRQLPGGDVEWRNPETMEGFVTDFTGATAKQQLKFDEHISLSDNEDGYAISTNIPAITVATVPSSLAPIFGDNGQISCNGSGSNLAPNAIEGVNPV